MTETINLNIINKADQAEEILVNLKIQDSTCLLYCNSKFGDSVFEASDFFECLKKLRRLLEKYGYLICCYGARPDVYPSRMSRQMSKGRIAYLMKIGEPATRNHLVNIFQSVSADKIDTIESQEAFYEKWIKSLNQDS